jgi:Iron-sulfur cluster assembly protein
VVERETVLGVLSRVAVPGGGDLVSRDLIRALGIEGGAIRFVIEAATPSEAQALAPAQAEAEARLRDLAGVTSVQVVMTARRSGFPASTGSSQLRRARVGSANPRWPRILPWLWRGLDGGLDCWMQTSMAQASQR